MARAAVMRPLAAPINELTAAAHGPCSVGRTGLVAPVGPLLHGAERVGFVPLVGGRERARAATVRLRGLTRVAVERARERAHALEANAHRDCERALVAFREQRHRLQQPALLEVLAPRDAGGVRERAAQRAFARADRTAHVAQ